MGLKRFLSQIEHSSIWLYSRKNCKQVVKTFTHPVNMGLFFYAIMNVEAVRGGVILIYTCTMNTAIDLFVKMDALSPNVVNRTTEEDYQANGKGVNVSVVLKELGIHSTALGFIAGFTGNYIKDELIKKQIATDFIEVEGITRVNIFVNANEEYKIVNKGPTIPENKVAELMDKVKMIPENSYLFVSGSLPQGIKDDIFIEISKLSQRNNLKLILDVSSPKLLQCLAYKPYLIKPNDEELAAFFNKKSLTEEELIYYGKELLNRGAQQVLVSRGEHGSIYLSKDETIKVSSLEGKVVNTACAGDTLLATFVGKKIQGASTDEALKYASAAGSLTAFSKGLGDFANLSVLSEKITVEHL